MKFPGQSTTVTVMRKTKDTTTRNPTYLGFQSTGQTGVPVHLRELGGSTSATDAGIDLTGAYRGACALSNDIRVGDILQDEQYTEADGTPIKFEVQESYPQAPFYLKLHLHRTSLGA